MLRLNEVTTAFDAAIWTGDTSALRELARPAVAQAARIRVHQNNVFVGLIQALADLYPRVRRFVGDEFFDAVAKAFLVAHPPASPAMIHFGAGFATFLDALDTLAAHRYVGDIARAELMWHQAYHARDAAPLRVEGLRKLTAGAWSAARLGLHPSAHLLSSRYPVDVLWDLSADDAVEPTAYHVPERGADVLIIRPHLEVELRVLTVPAFALIEALAECAAVAAACERAALHDAGFDAPSALRDLIAGGCFAEITTVSQP